jgi:hypothetical protein
MSVAQAFLLADGRSLLCPVAFRLLYSLSPRTVYHLGFIFNDLY